MLPALPKAWPNGRVSGLRARGGYEVDMQWSDGRLRYARLKASAEGECTVRVPKGTAVSRILSGGKLVEFKRTDDPCVIRFAVKPGWVYGIEAEEAR